jgi:protein TonB
MESNKILQSDFLDILFDDRNKVYGAYELRRSYDKRIVKALCITGIAIGLIVGSTLMAQPENEDNVKPDDKEDLVIRIIEDPVEAIEPPPPPPPPPLVEPPQVKMIDFMTPEIVDNELVTKTPPEQADFEGAQIGDMDTPGIDADNIAVPPPAINKIQVIEDKKVEPEIWGGKVEVEAEFPGGARAWEQFLRRNLHPDVPVDNNAAPGRYTVYLQFIVDKEGKVSDIKALTAHGFGMEEEAIRVLRKATTWHPANQNGRAVKAYRKQPITFVVEEQ